MDSVSVKDVVLESKMGAYSYSNLNNFQSSQELMVTITLNEYRKLVEDVATREDAIKKAESDKYERNNENEKLKEQINNLKAELYELKKERDSLLPVEVEPL